MKILHEGEVTVKFEHAFFDLIPQEIEPNVVYVSMRYRTSKHLCPCGCGSEVVTPIRPNRWSLVYNGSTVSLYPSIGNWSLECRSHYWLTENQIEWAEKWSDTEIEWGRESQRRINERYFESLKGERSSRRATGFRRTKGSWLKRTIRMIRGKLRH